MQPYQAYDRGVVCGALLSGNELGWFPIGGHLGTRPTDVALPLAEERINNEGIVQGVTASDCRRLTMGREEGRSRVAQRKK